RRGPRGRGGRTGGAQVRRGARAGVVRAEGGAQSGAPRCIGRLGEERRESQEIRRQEKGGQEKGRQENESQRAPGVAQGRAQEVTSSIRRARRSPDDHSTGRSSRPVPPFVCTGILIVRVWRSVRTRVSICGEVAEWPKAAVC